MYVCMDVCMYIPYLFQQSKKKEVVLRPVAFCLRVV